MTSPILVTGGTGTLGRFLVPRLRDAGCDVRVLSRSSHEHEREHGSGVAFVRGDLLTGEGIGAAVDGASVILHCASGKKGDEAATGNLVEVASRQATPPHLRASRRRRPVMPVRLPGLAKVRAGRLLPESPVTGRRTWEEFLAGKVG